MFQKIISVFVLIGIRSCACDIHNLEPFRDYKFRVRVENKYGVSDPSPFAVTFRWVIFGSFLDNIFDFHYGRI